MVSVLSLEKQLDSVPPALEHLDSVSPAAKQLHETQHLTLVSLGLDVHVAIFLKLPFKDASAFRATCTVFKAVTFGSRVKEIWMERHGDSYREALRHHRDRLALLRMRRQYAALDDELLEIDTDACAPHPVVLRSLQHQVLLKKRVFLPSTSKQRKSPVSSQVAARAAALRKQQEFFAALDRSSLEHEKC
eukprot:scaffold148111_cov36-Tisochrysis_lutea.AAC.1